MMTDQQLANFRDSTKLHIPYSHAKKTCPCCNKSQSVGQFDKGLVACKTCRGVK